MHFAISTFLHHEERLQQTHLEAIASRGFEAIELFALRDHFDYHEPTAAVALEGWLHATGLTLHAIHAPIATGLQALEAGPRFSIASANQAERTLALGEIRAALGVAERIRPAFLVVHLGAPGSEPGDNRPDVARRSLEEIRRETGAAGVGLALEVIPNALSSAEALVRLIEDDLEGGDVGICLDFGHAHLMEDLIDAIESVSGHLITTHVHDNHGRTDDHLVPFEGGIDWASALMALLKIGYDGRLVLELDGGADPRAVLDRAARARDGLAGLLA